MEIEGKERSTIFPMKKLRVKMALRPSGFEILEAHMSYFHDYFMECKGENNTGKSHEVSSRLNRLNPDVAILTETRVKPHNAQK